MSGLNPTILTLSRRALLSIRVPRVRPARASPI